MLKVVDRMAEAYKIRRCASVFFRDTVWMQVPLNIILMNSSEVEIYLARSF